MHSIEELKTAFYIHNDQLFWKIHNRKCKPGTVAGNKNKAGYIDIRYKGKRYYAHRIIFAFTHNRWPKGFVDHINGIPWDNRPCNLREVDHAESSANTKTRSHNTSGVKGVSKHGAGWVSELSFRKKRYRKYFTDFALAVQWIQKLRVEIHETFANFN